MAFIKKDILQHLVCGGHIRCNGGYFALMDGGFVVKCSNRSMNALLRDGLVVNTNNNIVLSDIKEKV